MILGIAHFRFGHFFLETCLKASHRQRSTIGWIKMKIERLFELLALLRSYRYPVSAKTLAEKLNVSTRTLYRDIATLKTQGADIEGEPGLGFQLKPGFLLPPMMFDKDELEALVLGMRWVIQKGDTSLQNGAKSVLNKVRAVLPKSLQDELDFSSLMVGPNLINCTDDESMKLLRTAVRNQKVLEISYIDLKENKSRRIIWPIGIAFFDGLRVLIAWCEKRQDFRHFRTDRIKKIINHNKKYPKSKPELLSQWRKIHNIPEP